MKAYNYTIVPPFQKQKEIIVELAKHYKIKVYFVKSTPSSPGAGYFVTSVKGTNPRIHIVDNRRYNLLEIFFHELGHFHCWKNYIWPKYHDRSVRMRKGLLSYSPQDLRAKILTAYKAECWVDAWGGHEMLKWFPNLSYRASYIGSEYARKWLHDNHLYKYKAALSKKQKAK